MTHGRVPLSVLALVVCAGVWVSGAVVAAQFALISIDEEIEIGQRADDELRKSVPELLDARTATYIRAVGRRLARAAPGPKYPYSFSVADYREVNAFALPGGPIWIHRGVIQAAASESQVAAVLAHEVAHLSNRHAADQLTKGIVANLGLGLLGAMLGNTGGAEAAQAAAGLLTNGMFLKFSRDDEREADRAGLQLLRRAGWDGRGMIEMFEILRREARRDPSSVDVFFSSHPAPADRIEGLRAEVVRVRGGTRDTRQFHSVKTRLLKMPAARAMPRQ